MFRWDAIGETQICFDGVDAAAPAVAALLDTCTVPIAVHDYLRAGILGTGTLLSDGGRTLLLTAAHLFERATSSGNWLVPERASGHLLALEGAQVRVIAGADIALIELARARALPRLMLGRTALPARLALRARAAAHHRKPRAAPPAARVTYCLAGYPAAWSRFERGYLAAKRLTVTTVATNTVATARPHVSASNTARANEEARLDLRCVYGHCAQRNDGQVIHTPALEGMSGAAIWRLERGQRESALHLAGVQSAFVHSRYLRGDAAQSCARFLESR